MWAAGWSDNRRVLRDTSLFEYVNEHLCTHQSLCTISWHLISEFFPLWKYEDCLSHMILIPWVMLVAQKSCSYKMGTFHVHAAPKPGSNIWSYLPVFLKDGLVSLLEHALQWHHFLFQLTDQDEVIRASRIHRLSDWTTGGKEKEMRLIFKERMCQPVWMDRDRQRERRLQWEVNTCLHWMALSLVWVFSLAFPSECCTREEN